MNTANQSIPPAAGEAAHGLSLPLEVTRFSEGDFGVCGAGGGDTYFSGLTEANAAFIVRACNSHAALVASLDETLSVIRLMGCDMSNFAQASAALKYAKEGQ